MNKLHRLLLLATCMLPMFFVACNKDDITVVDDTTGGGGGSVIGDDVDNIDTNYDRTVNVVFATAGATVSGTGDSLQATVSGNDVTIRNLGTEKVCYNVSGSSSDGYLKIYSGRKQAVVLNSVSLKNTRGAAINVQGAEATPNKGKRVDLMLRGSSTLADGATYSLTPSGEDEKAVIFSEGQIVVSGSGTLGITATGKAGITSDDYVAILDGCSVSVASSGGHGVRGKDCVLVVGGTLDINVTADGKKGISSDSLVRFEGGQTTISISGNTVVESGDTSGTAGVKADILFEMVGGSLGITNSGTGGKGISCDGDAYFRGGEVTVTVTGSNFGTSSSGGGHGPGGGGWGGGGSSSNDNSVGAKGIKCDGNIEISGGSIVVTASNHEGIETKGTLTITGGDVYSQSSDDAINSASTMTISGGYVYAYSTGNDGLDANGNLYIRGGVVCAICTGSNNAEVAVDANTEGGYRLYIEGGVLFTCGALERNSQLSQQCYQASSWTKNVWYSLDDGTDTYAIKTPTSGGSRMVVSAAQRPTVASGVTVSGGTTLCNGRITVGADVSGGSSVTLSNYSNNSGW